MAIFECSHCNLKLTNEETFNKHYCEDKMRSEFIRTPRGIAVFAYYKEWLKVSRNGSISSEDTFLKSRYYNAFVNFIEFSNKMMLPNKSAFIKYVSIKGILPIHWCNDDVYISYIQNLDTVYTPLEQAEETIKTIHDLARAFDCKSNQIFEFLEVGDCLKLLKARRLSPWVLLFSKQFHQYLAIKLSKEQRIIIQSVINPTVWRNKFQIRPLDVAKMKKMVEDLNL